MGTVCPDSKLFTSAPIFTHEPSALMLETDNLSLLFLFIFSEIQYVCAQYSREGSQY